MEHVAGSRGPGEPGAVAERLDRSTDRPGEGEWWQAASTLAGRVSGRGGVQPGETDWYRLGDGFLGLRSDDSELQERFGQLYGECRVEQPPGADQVQVVCTVRSLDAPAISLISFEDPEPLDQIAFATALFPQRGYVEIPSPVDGWRLLGTPDEAYPIRENEILVRREAPWQMFAANLAINRVLRLQRELLFFHAASVAIRGEGLLLVGPRGAGKTTLSMACAARGHDFLGDEMAGVRKATLELVPIRRAVSVRPGLRAGAVDAALRDLPPPSEAFQDGTPRLRTEIARLFPQAPARVVPMRGIVFLRGFAERPRLERLTPAREHLADLPPMGSTLWGVPAALRVVQLLSLMARVRCYNLHAGPPDQSVELLERSLED